MLKIMNVSYEYIVTRCVKCWSNITKQTLVDMFERADDMCCDLKDFKAWLSVKPMAEDIKKYINTVYRAFTEKNTIGLNLELA